MSSNMDDQPQTFVDRFQWLWEPFTSLEKAKQLLLRIWPYLLAAFGVVCLLIIGFSRSCPKCVSVKMSSCNEVHGAFPKSCKDYATIGINKTDKYLVDPDGPRKGVQPFWILCKFENGGSTAVVHHDHEETEQITPCRGHQCFALNLTYELTSDQIEALVTNSNGCSQEFRFDCYLSKLANRGFWIDRHGQKQQYFDDHKVPIASPFCWCWPRCGVAHVAKAVNYRCNCDLGDTVKRFDTGLFKDRDLLPMQSFHYGNMYMPEQWAKVTVGPLECT